MTWNSFLRGQCTKYPSYQHKTPVSALVSNSKISFPFMVHNIICTYGPQEDQSSS